MGVRGKRGLRRERRGVRGKRKVILENHQSTLEFWISALVSIASMGVG